jgi:hypothetical protein
MFLIFFLIIFILLINNNYIYYNENFILALSLILFFIIIYITLKNKIKFYNFIKLIKFYFIFILLFRLNNYYSFEYLLCCLIKKTFINKLKIKIYYLNLAFKSSLNNILKKNNILINLLSLLINKNNFKELNNIVNFLIYFFDFK